MMFITARYNVYGAVTFYKITVTFYKITTVTTCDSAWMSSDKQANSLKMYWEWVT